MDIINIIATELRLKESSVSSAINLIDEWNTIPFIARYRKEATGNLTDTDLRKLEERLIYLRKLEERMNTVLKSIEEQGANFLYLIVKNHVFADGNKRIAATLFIYFLNFYGILYKNDKQVIDNNTLTALTLLIAESNPKEKDVIIDLVMNFLNND